MEPVFEASSSHNVTRTTIIIEYLERMPGVLLFSRRSLPREDTTFRLGPRIASSNNASCTCHGFRSFRLDPTPLIFSSFHAIRATNLVPPDGERPPGSMRNARKKIANFSADLNGYAHATPTRVSPFSTT